MPEKYRCSKRRRLPGVDRVVRYSPPVRAPHRIAVSFRGLNPAPALRQCTGLNGCNSIRRPACDQIMAVQSVGELTCAPLRAGLRVLARVGVIGVTALVLASLAAAPAVHAVELPPAVHARLFRPTSVVVLARPVVTIPMEGTDQHGYYRCPYFQVYVNGQRTLHLPVRHGRGLHARQQQGRGSGQAAGGLRPQRSPRCRERRRDRIGGATLKDIWAIHDDDFGVDGIIGFPAFGMVNVLFDLSGRQLRVRALAHRPCQTALSFRTRHR